MKSVFSRESGAGFSYLRVPLGANDFSNGNYSLDDTKGNKPDPNFNDFQKKILTKEMEFIKIAKKINPDLKILITPWTPPAWMKDTKKLNGGQLKIEYQRDYANYLGKSIQSFQDEGIKVDHMTILNEPLIGWAATNWSFPQAYMSTAQQKDFLINNLLPISKNFKNFPKILIHDHNWDNAGESIAMAKEPKLKSMIGGIALHCYGGEYNDQRKVLADFRPLNGINTECSSLISKNAEAESFDWWLKTQSLDSLRAGSSGGLGWNLCLDETGGPKNNGCQDCRGLVTIDQKNSKKITYNPEFEALAFSSRALRSGSVRIQSNDTSLSEVTNVAFKNPDGKIVVLLRNSSAKNVKLYLKIFPCKNNLQVEVPAHSAASLRLNEIF
jgi:glucosylceramidase